MITTRTLLAAFLLASASCAAVTAMDYEPYTYRQNFEIREMMGWSSYPPIQDAAYEAPYIYPGAVVPGEPGAVLCKIIQPEWDSPQLTGVVKRLRMHLDDTSRIRFRYYIKTTLAPAWLGIDMGLADGGDTPGRVRARFANPKTNTWVAADYHLADILAAAGLSHTPSLDITALAITVRFDRADPDMPIVLGIDDVEVSGYRQATFDFREPKVETLDEWESRIALRHYRNGDTLTLTGSFRSSNPDGIAVRIARFDRPDSTVETRRMIRSGAGWTLDSPLVLAAARYPAGMYEATLTGARAGAECARSTFTFLVVDPARFAGHPRLWFERGAARAFADRMKQGTRLLFFEQIRAEAKNTRETQSPDLPDDLDTFPTKGWLKSFEPYRHRIATMPQAAFASALVWVLDGDERAADFAGRVLLSLAGWRTWTHPWMASRGHQIYLYQWYTAYNLGLTYDILYDRLSDAERKKVREAFLRNALLPAYRTYVVGDQCTCNESNWIPAIVGGALTAVCSILGEGGDTSAIEPSLSGCLYKLRAHMDASFGGDSACLEGFGYASGTMWIESAVLPLLERSLGIDLSRKMDRSYLEMFWAADHAKKRWFSFGDTNLTPPTTSAFPWLVEKYRDPELAWFLDANPPEPNFVSYHTVLSDTEGVPRRKPVLDGARLFRKTGTAVFRTGEDEGPFVLTFRCGPFGNHQHLDQGTFYLADRGELLITELGYSDYYEDPFYQSHIIQPIGHNCILVDHSPQSQRAGDHGEYAPGMYDRARITAFVEGGGLAFALGELGPVYTGNVRSLKRGVLHIRPRTALVIDLLETRSGEASMDALFHTPVVTGASLDSDITFSIRSGDVTLRGWVVHPMSPVIRIDPDPVKLANYTNTPIVPTGRITVTSETRDGRAMTAVLLSTDLRLTKVTSTRDGSIVELEGASILLNRTGAEYTGGGLSTDGLLAAASPDGTVLLAEGRLCVVNGRTVVASDIPVTVLKTGSTFRYSAAAPATVRFACEEKIRTVMVNGKGVKEWARDRTTGMVTLRLPAGQGEVKLNR